MWEIILWILLFIGAYFLIFFSVDVFLDNLKELCLAYGLSAFIIGALVVGIGIDLEEFATSTIASVNGLPYLALGNVIGNSIIALTLCFALPAILYKFKFNPVPSFYFLIIYASFFMIVLGFFLPFGLLIAGIITLGLYSIYFIRNLRHFHEMDLEESNVIEEKGLEQEEKKEKTKRRMILLVIIGLLIIILAGELLVLSAEEIIKLTGLSESFFGFVIIAFVNNVEELTLITKAIKKHAVEVGLGGMLGKLIVNLTLVFGVSGIILINIVLIPSLIWNSVILLLILLIINLIVRKGSMNRKDGIILAIIFVTFLVFNFIWH
jgi:cation:H+ antiporter